MSATWKRILSGAGAAGAALLLLPPLAWAQSTSLSQAIRTNPEFNQYSIPANDDGSSSVVQLGFTINFFGRQRSSVFVNNNGNVTFDAPLPTYTPFGLEGTHREIIAAFFADVDTRPKGSKLVTYGQSLINGHKAFGVNYVNVGYYNQHADKLNSFQLILVDRSDAGAGNFDIEFNYARIVWETGDASGGVNGYGGVSASVGWSNGSGDPGTSWELEGSRMPGSFLDYAPRSLVRTRFNSTAVGRYLFRARDGSISPGLTISSGCPLPNGTAGSNYQYRVSALGEKPPFAWSLLADPGATVPVSISPDGLVSGRLGSIGEYDFTLRVSATGEDGPVTVAKRCSITADPPQTGIRSACPLPEAVAGAQYSQTLSAAGGTAPYTWSLVGSVAPGLSLSNGGVLSGRPAAAGTYLFSLRAVSSDTGAIAAEKSCSLVVRPSAPYPAISGCPASTATIGVPYSETLGASGGTAPYTWSVSGLLPTGLSLSPAGVVSGIPSVEAPFYVQLRAMDALGRTAAQDCTIYGVQAVVQVTSACPLPAATQGLPYRQQLGAQGGTGAYTWSIAGSLPSGLQLSSDGVIGGTPGASGPFLFRLLATDDGGSAGGAGCSLTVNRPSFSISSCPLPPAAAGESYNQALNVVGGEAPYSWSSSGSLPAGLLLSASGQVAGAPQSAGSYDFALRVIDAKGATTTQPCALVVDPPLPRVTTACPLRNGQVGAPYSATLAATGGTPAYTWFATGDLPAGLSLDAGGTLSGTPSKPGDYAFTLRGVDSRNKAMAKDCSLAVSLPAVPAITLLDIPAVVSPATSNIGAGVVLSATYSLPMQGVATLTVAPETGNPEAELNRADPLIRFTNGQQFTRFTIPAGARSAALPVVSSGTVASTVTFAVSNLEAGGSKVSSSGSPKLFRIQRLPPVVTTACFKPAGYGLDLVATGYSTTRELSTVDVTVAGKTVTQNVSFAASDYYHNEESIRTGGAFTVTLPVDLGGSVSASSVSFTLFNAAGASAARSASRCQ